MDCAIETTANATVAPYDAQPAALLPLLRGELRTLSVELAASCAAQNPDNVADVLSRGRCLAIAWPSADGARKQRIEAALQNARSWLSIGDLHAAQDVADHLLAMAELEGL